MSSPIDAAHLYRTGRDIVEQAMAQLVLEGRAPRLAQEFLVILLREVSLHLYQAEQAARRAEQENDLLTQDPFADPLR